MDAYTDRLSDYVDNEELDAGERKAIEAHLETCSSCRAAVADLLDIATQARGLPDLPPVADLWPGIARRIQTKRISFTLPQLIAASLALMVLSGAMVWVSIVGGSRTDIQPLAATNDQPTAATTDQPVAAELANFADTEYDQAVADLEEALAAGRGTLDPQTVRVLEANLRAIDRAIEQSRKALSADPGNLFLNTHLAATRKRKLELLRSATALTTKS